MGRDQLIRAFARPSSNRPSIGGSRSADPRRPGCWRWGGPAAARVHQATRRRGGTHKKPGVGDWVRVLCVHPPAHWGFGFARRGIGFEPTAGEERQINHL